MKNSRSIRKVNEKHSENRYISLRVQLYIVVDSLRIAFRTSRIGVPQLNVYSTRKMHRDLFWLHDCIFHFECLIIYIIIFILYVVYKRKGACRSTS